MKKTILVLSIAILLGIAFFGWQIFGSSVTPPEKKYFYIPTGSTMQQVKAGLIEQKIARKPFWYSFVANRLGYKTAKPGKYEIKSGSSLFSLIRMLKNGRQTPVELVITKVRTKELLAGKIGRLFECDSTTVIQYLSKNSSPAKYGLDSNTLMAIVMPLTYESKWNTTPDELFNKFHDAHKIFWTEERKQKASQLKLSPIEVSTLASIIDEETNAKSDRPNIASAYLNRIQKSMPLQADPTIKFAMKDFKLKRILNVHLKYPSPYNTYINKGLPPGPICTPRLETIDAVLNAPKTDYIFFVANSNFDGTHIFTTNYSDHLKYAALFQQELNKRNIK